MLKWQVRSLALGAQMALLVCHLPQIVLLRFSCYDLKFSRPGTLLVKGVQFPAWPRRPPPSPGLQKQQLHSAACFGRKECACGALLQHAATNRRDADCVDCFAAGRLRVGYFRRTDWESTRKWASSCPQASTICCGAAWSSASLGGRIAHCPSLACIWDGCDELGTFDHIAWTSPGRPDVHSLPARPALGLSAWWGWVVKGTRTDYDALHRWLETVQSRLVGCFPPVVGLLCLHKPFLPSWLGSWFLLLSDFSVASYVTETLLKLFAWALPVWGYLHLKVIYIWGADWWVLASSTRFATT